MAERIGADKGDLKDLLAKDLAATRLHSEASFWLDMAKGLLPAASESLHDGVKTGEVWGALGQGAALGIGLSWMTNKFRPMPVRVIGGIINAGFAGKFAWDSGQVVGQVLHLKNKAVVGNYGSSVHEAQKLAGKFCADNTVGILGAHIGFVGEHGIHHAMSTWKGKPQIAATVPVGVEAGSHPLGNPHDISESPFYMAMSKGRKNKNRQKAFEQKPVEARPVAQTESARPSTTDKTVQAADPLEASSKAEPEKREDIFKLLNEQAVRKGKPADPESYEDWSYVKKQQGKEAFDSIHEDVADLVGEMTYENRSIKQYRKLSTELAELRSSKSDEALAEQLLNDMDSHANPHYTEYIADSVLNANEKFAGDVRDIARSSPFVRDLFLEARSGEYPEDAFVLFTDKNGRLIQYSNEYVAYKPLHYPLKHVAKGVAEFELIGSDVIKGAAIFGSPEGGGNPLLGTVGDVPVRLSLCGNAREFVMSSRLNKPLSHFIYKGIERELGKPALAEGDKCAGGVCPLPEEFTAKLKASKTGALSKPEAMHSEALNATEFVAVHEGKPETVPLTKPKEMPVAEIQAPKPAESAIEPAANTSSLSAEQQIKLSKLDKEARQLYDVLLTNEQLSKKQRKIFDKRLKQIEEEKASLLGEPKTTEAPIAKNEQVLEDQTSLHEKARQEETRQAEMQKFLEYQAIEREARELGLPEGIYGKTHEVESEFKTRTKEAQEAYLAKQAEEARLRATQEQMQTDTTTESQQTAPKSETRTKAYENKQVRDRQDYTDQDHIEMEVDLSLENEFLAKAFKSAKIRDEARLDDTLVFFVKDSDGVISCVSSQFGHGKTGPIKFTKLDFHYGKVPVELLKNEVVGWARVGPKVQNGGYAHRVDRRNPEKKLIDTQIVEVGGQVPPTMQAAMDRNGCAPYAELVVAPKKVLSTEKLVRKTENYDEALVAEYCRRRESIQSELDGHYQSIVEGVDEGRLMSSKIEEYKSDLAKLDGLIAKHEGRKADQANSASFNQDSSVRKTAGESVNSPNAAESILVMLHKERASIMERFKEHGQAMKNGVENRMLTPQQIEELGVRLLEIDGTIARHEGRIHKASKEAEPTGNAKYGKKSDNAERSTQETGFREEPAPNPNERRAVVVEPTERLTADIIHSLESYRSVPQARMKPENGVPSVSDKLDALVCVAYNAHSRAMELFTQGKMAEAEAWANTLVRLVKEGSVKVPGEVPKFDNLDKIRADSLLVEILRMQNKPNEVGKILNELNEQGLNINNSIGVWNKALARMRDRQTAQIDMMKNAKELEKSLRILNWFNITL